MELYSNLDLFSVGLAVAGIVTLGFTVFFNDPRSVTNRSFLFFSLITGVWGVVNFFSYRISNPTYAIWLVRMAIFLAIWQAFSIHHLFMVFPKIKFNYSASYLFYLIPLTIGVSIITLTPFALSSVTELSSNGRILKIINGPGMIPFGILSVGLVSSGIFMLFQKIRAEQKKNKKPFLIILFGASVMFFLIILFNFIFPSLVQNTSFIPFGALFTLPFVVSAWIAIYRHNLFNIKTIAVSILTALLALITFSEVILAENLTKLVFRTFIFLFTLTFGVLIIRSIQREIGQREEINRLAENLKKTNTQLEQTNEKLRVIDQRKSEFVSIVSHQLRTPITAVKGYSSLLLEDAYGPLTELQKTQVNKVFVSSNRLANMVNDFLDISKIEQGTMKYIFSTIDVKLMLQELFDDFQIIAQKKGLSLEFSCPPTETFNVIADEGKLRQIFSNLLDNSIKYTPSGGIVVSIAKDPHHDDEVICKLKDTGIGLSQDDIHHLFGKFTRGLQGQRQNTEGSGLGLYVAKKMLEAMHGKIWVDSEGPNKGSTFVIVLSNKGESGQVTL